ncbi:putative d-amino acid oxidase protein [Paramyrothecium foliicola]|nr:putative d-amino acid oxidase protein [Paramyrothecium foliicola]
MPSTQLSRQYPIHKSFHKACKDLKSVASNMVQTRSRSKATDPSEEKRPPTKTSKAHSRSDANDHEATKPSKRRRSNKPATDPRQADSEQGNSEHESLTNLADRLLWTYGEAPLQGLLGDNEPPSNIVLAHILNGLLSSTRISHQIAAQTFACLVEEQYHDLKVLHGTSWEDRTKVLTKGGYTRYREKTATYLGDLAKLLKDQYEQKGDKARGTLSTRLKEIKGVGPVGADIILGSIQSFFPGISPVLDKRSMGTAQEVGMGEDLGAIFSAIGRDPDKMTRLEVALTKIRLDKLQGEFK